METSERKLSEQVASDLLAEAWFDQPVSSARLRVVEERRPTSRPPPPPPIDDAIADGWFR